VRKKLTPFPSSFHMSNEGGKKKHLFVPPFSLKSKRNKKNNMYSRTPYPETKNKYNKIIPLAILNSKK
jgi:hypothetical protein